MAPSSSSSSASALPVPPACSLSASLTVISRPPLPFACSDEVPTSEILYTTNEGLSWNTYDFGETLNVVSIQTVPSDTSRKFLVFGSRPRKNEETVAVYVDFSALTTRKCEQKMDDPNHDDFELWSPAESREETCLFGRQVRPFPLPPPPAAAFADHPRPCRPCSTAASATVTASSARRPTCRTATSLSRTARARRRTLSGAPLPASLPASRTLG